MRASWGFSCSFAVGIVVAGGCGGSAPADLDLGGVTSVTAAVTGTCSWRNTAPVTVAAPWGNVTFTPPTIPCNIFTITSYGAVGNGTTKNTTALKNAVAAAVGWSTCRPATG